MVEGMGRRSKEEVGRWKGRGERGGGMGEGKGGCEKRGELWQGMDRDADEMEEKK